MTTPHNRYERYHAHVYFEAATADRAAALCHQVGERFQLPVGRVHRVPIGPHPVGSCQISFGADAFEPLIPWLEAHRQGLTILVHGLTGDDLADHTDHAAWLGEPQALNLSIFKAPPPTSAGPLPGSGEVGPLEI
jgi:aromatic ring-cleaving dioxygenase